ncbi:chromosome partitioning protein ParA, partial [Limosilactobacillus reuteri]
TADLPNVRKQADSAVKFAESAIAASKVNSDAIVAQSEAISEAKSAMDSATAEIQQLKANAASDVARIESTIAEVQAGVNQAKSANESAVQAVQAELKLTSDSMDKVEKRLDEVDTSLDAYAKSAAEQGHDITLIKQKQGQFEADFASAQGNVNQIQADIKGLRQNIKDNQGNIASLLTSADKLQASMTDAEKNISNLLLTASKYEQTFKDQDGRLSKVEQTATEHTSELADTKGNLDKVTQKANALQLLLSDAQKNIQNIQLDAEGLHDTLTGQSNQLASLNVTLNNLDSKYSGITGDLQSKQTALSTEQQQTKDMLLLKADQTEVDNVKNTSQQLSSRLDVMADQIKSKVTSTDVNNIVDGKGYATTSTVQSLITQKAGTINESITNLDAKYRNINGVNLVHNSGFHNVTIDELKNSGWYINDGIWINKAGGPNKNGSIVLDYRNGTQGTTLDMTQILQLEPDTDYTLSFHVLSGEMAVGKPFDAWTFFVEHDASGRNVNPYVDNGHPMANNYDRNQNTRTFHTTKNTHSGVLYLRANPGTKVELEEIKLERGKVESNTAWTPAPSDNATVTQIQSITASIDGVQSNVTNLKNDTSSKITQLSNTIQSKVSSSDFNSKITQLANDINLRVTKGDLLSQINLTAGNTLIQSNKLYLDASSVVITGTAFIPSAAIASLSADKVNTGCLNTNNVSLGDGRTRIRADHDYMYIQPTGSAASNTGIRMGYSGLDFLTNVIPNGYNSSVPYYSIGYDGASNGYLRISAFDHINPGGATATQNRYTMVDAISLTNREVNFAAKGNMHMQVVEGGVNIKPTLLFQNNTNNGTYVGFTRLDNSDTVEFNTGNNNGENFHVNSGARFMQYVYINGNARAQSWLTNSTLSKKTNIRKLDQQIALDKIRQDDQYLYEYKRNIEQGTYDPQASFIIDDVNDVSHYSAPREFIDQSGNYREPNVELAYLIAAFQEIDKQVQKQKEEIKELKEKLQHE